MKIFYRVFAFFIITSYLILGIVTLSDYGLNWDETNHLTRGQAYLYFFLTGKEQYDKSLFEKGKRYSIYQIPGYDFNYQKVKDGDHPVFSDIASSFFNYILYQRLGVMNDFDSYHVYGVFVATLLLIFFFFWVEKIYGGFAAIIATLSLVLYPLFYGESHFNVQKDIPLAVFFTISLLSFYTGFVKKSVKWVLISALFFGFGWGTKFNILFLPLIVILWLSFKEKSKILRGLLSLPRSLKFAFIVYPIIGFVIFFGTWPHLWFDPIKNIIQVFTYYKQFGIIDQPSMPASYYILGFNTYAIQWVLYATPLVILVLTAAGIIFTITNGGKEKNKTSLFVLLWFILPIIRVTLPNTSIYGGVRQIMEYIPAMAILSGIGALYLVQLMHNSLAKNFKKFLKYLLIKPIILLQILTILLFIPITLKLISIHPNESIYFNELIGGLKGAKERNIPGWGNSLGSTYRQGKYWLNAHAEKNAKVALVYELTSNIPKRLLREDIDYSNTFRSGPLQKGEYVIGVTHYGTFEESYHRKYLERFLNPVYEVKVDDVAVLKVWKNDKEHTKEEYKGQEKPVKPKEIRKENDVLIIEFPQTIRLARIEIEYENTDCILPENGRYKISTNGVEWMNIPGNIYKFPDFAWFNANLVELQKQNKLEYLFAAEVVKFVGITRNHDNSCLFLHPVNVVAWEI